MRLVFNTIPFTTTSHSLNTKVLSILSPRGVVTINFFLRGVNSWLVCNANEVLMNDLLALESNKTRKAYTCYRIWAHSCLIRSHSKDAGLCPLRSLFTLSSQTPSYCRLNRTRSLPTTLPKPKAKALGCPIVCLTDAVVFDIGQNFLTWPVCPH